MAKRLRTLELKNYITRVPEQLIIKSILNSRTKGIRAFQLKGPPGVGKTYFTQCLAEAMKAKYLFYSCHSETSFEELIEDIDIPRVVVGTSDLSQVMRPGVLPRACLASQTGPVVLCLDEIDKTPEKIEALLLDFLQHGRIVLNGDIPIVGNPNNIYVFLTSNAVRELMEATERRCMNINMSFLPASVEEEVLRKKTGLSKSALKKLVHICNIVRNEEDCSNPSLQEMEHFCNDARLCNTPSDVRFFFVSHIVKTEEDHEILESHLAKFCKEFYQEVKDARV